MTCPHTGKWLGGCRFEPRYDVGSPRGKFDRIEGGVDLVELLNSTKPKTYIHDICVVCGKIVQRSDRK